MQASMPPSAEHPPPNLFQRLSSALNPFSHGLLMFSGLTVFLLMLFVVADVLGRALFNKPILGSLEVCELMMVVACFPAFIHTQHQSRHLGVDLFTCRLSHAWQAVLGVFTWLIGAVYLGILAYQMSLVAVRYYARAEVTHVLHIPMWLFMAFAAVCVGLFALFTLLSAWGDWLRAQSSGKTLEAALGLVLALLVCWAPFALAGSSLGIPKTWMGGVIMLYLLALAFLGLPIGLCMIVSGVQGLLLVMPNAAIALSMAGGSPFHSVGAILMVVVPMFVLMGEFALYGNVSSDLFRTCSTWLGHMPGGLAIATVGGCAGFAAVCGDSIATAMTMATVSMPAMREKGYDPAFSAACLAIGGPLGILIPPSLGFLVYAIVTEESVGKLFMAGIIPGILLTVTLGVIIYLRARANPKLAPRGDKSTWNEKIRSLTGVLPMTGLFLVIMGGMLTGLCTPNEGGALASFACLLYCLARRSISWQQFKHSLTQTAVLTSKIFIVLVGVGLVGYFLAATRFPTAMSGLIAASGLSKYGVLLAVIVMYIILGCLMNVIPMIMLTLPAIFPSIQALGFDPVWFGVITVLLMELGQVTPPVGMLVFAMSSVVPDVPVARIFYQIFPFFLGILLMILLITIFPQIALFLPNVFFSTL